MNELFPQWQWQGTLENWLVLLAWIVWWSLIIIAFVSKYFYGDEMDRKRVKDHFMNGESRFQKSGNEGK